LEKLRHSSEQSTRELRSRLAAAEKQLGDIDNLKSAEAQSSDSSFKVHEVNAFKVFRRVFCNKAKIRLIWF